MRKLYEIEGDLANLIELDADRFVNGETGEIIDRKAFDDLQVEWNAKIEAVICGYKNEDILAKSIKEEIKNLTARMKQHEKRANGYKTFLDSVMNGKKFECSKGKITYKKSEMVNVTCDVRNLPEVYQRWPEPEANKELIKKDLKNNIVIPGCELVKKNNIQIK